MAGPAAAKTIQEIIKGGNQPRIGAIAAVLGLAILAIGASSVFGSPLSKQRRHYDAPDQGTLLFVRDVLGTGFLLLLSLVMNAWMMAMRIIVPRGAT